MLAQRSLDPYAERQRYAVAALDGVRKVLRSQRDTDTHIDALASYLARHAEPGDAVNVIEQIDAGVFVMNLRRRFVFVNERTCEALGKQQEQLLGQPLRDCIPQHEHAGLLKHLKTVLTFKRYGWLEIDIVTASGTAETFRTSGTMIRVSGIPYVLGLVLPTVVA